MPRVSLGQGQPFFFTSDIAYVEISENKQVNDFRIIGYSNKQNKYICLFKSDNRGAVDTAMDKLGKLLDVEYH